MGGFAGMSHFRAASVLWLWLAGVWFGAESCGRLCLLGGYPAHPLRVLGRHNLHVQTVQVLTWN